MVRRITALFALVFVLAACGAQAPTPPHSSVPVSIPPPPESIPPPPSIEVPESAPPVETPEPVPSEELSSGDPDTLAAPANSVTGRCEMTAGDLEGCYSYEQMFEFLDLEAEEHVYEFTQWAFGGAGGWPTVEFAYNGEVWEDECGAWDDTAYGYCRFNEKVMVGQNMLWKLYNDLGDAAAIGAFAHELGHYMQDVAGILRDDDNVPLSHVIARENQADCVAGAWVNYAISAGYMTDDDIGDLVVLVQAIASAEGDPNRDHGTLQERADSMDYGIQYGLWGCNEYFPTAPLIVPAGG